MQRRKFKKRDRSISKKIWRIGLGVLVLFLILDAYLLLTSRFFNIKSVEIVLDKVNCTDEVTIKKEASFSGKNFFFVNIQKFENQIKKKYICIKSANLTKDFPDKVKIEITGREAIATLILLNTEESTHSASLENIASIYAALIKEQSSDKYLVDLEGIVFSKAGQITGPKLFFRGNLSIGKKVEEKIVENALEILTKLKSFEVNVSNAIIYPDDSFLLYPLIGKPGIIFTLKKNIEIQHASLQLILTQAKIEEQEMEFIDLRYDKPIIKYVPEKSNYGKR